MPEKKKKLLIVFIAGKLDMFRSPELALKFHDAITKALGAVTPISKSGTGGALVYGYSTRHSVEDVAKALTKKLQSSGGFLLAPEQHGHDVLLVIDVSEQRNWYASSDVYRAAVSL
jgi:hypothetical protein